MPATTSFNNHSIHPSNSKSLQYYQIPFVSIIQIQNPFLHYPFKTTLFTMPARCSHCACCGCYRGHWCRSDPVPSPARPYTIRALPRPSTLETPARGYGLDAAQCVRAFPSQRGIAPDMPERRAPVPNHLQGRRHLNDSRKVCAQVAHESDEWASAMVASMEHARNSIMCEAQAFDW